MKMAILITAPPYTSPAPISALHFVEAALKLQHEITKVFFYQDGVLNLNALSCPPTDELNLPERWQRLAEEHSIELAACVASALKRGVLDVTEAKRYDKGAHSLIAGAKIAGLGSLIEAIKTSDRLITFKG